LRQCFKIFAIIFVLSFSLGQQGQLKTGWERVLIPEVGFIDIPPTLELQDKEKNPMLSAANQNALYIQQKGLNDFQKSSYDTYVRVIIETEISGDNEYETLDTKYFVTQSELKELDEILKPQFKNPYTKIIDWFPTSTVDINNIRALLIHYTRVGNTKGKHPVDVKMYKFQNYDRLHTVTVSYRIRDKYKWKTDLEDVLKSFTITNVKKPLITNSINNPIQPNYSEFEKRRISREKEKGFGKIILFFLFIPIYTITRFIKEKFRKKDLDENTIAKLRKGIKTAGGYSLGWGVIQIIGAILLINSQGIENFIGMSVLSIPVIVCGNIIYKRKFKSYKPFSVIFGIMIFFIFILPFLLISILGDEGLRWFDVAGFSIYHFGPSWLTLLLGYFSISGWLSFWILKRNNLLNIQIIESIEKEKENV
jgi:hypothetical protein